MEFYAPCQYCDDRYPTGFKPAITLGRSNKIASNSVCRYTGPITIDLFCSLVFMPFVTEIQLNKLRPLSPARLAPMILANLVPFNVWGGGCYTSAEPDTGIRAREIRWMLNCRDC